MSATVGFALRNEQQPCCKTFVNNVNGPKCKQIITNVLDDQTQPDLE